MKVRPLDYLNGVSPLDQAERNKRIAFQHIYNFGWSTDKLITALLGKKATGWAATQVRSGWLQRTEIEGSLLSPLFTLSNKGLEWVEEIVEEVHSYPELSPQKIHRPLINHTLLAQRFVIFSRGINTFVGYKTERQYATLDLAGVKRPDMVFEYSDVGKTAIEIELSAKFDKRLDDFVFKVVRDIGFFGDEKRYQGYLIISKSAALLKNYKEAFAAGSVVNEWYRGTNDRLLCMTHGNIPREISRRVGFIHESRPSGVQPGGFRLIR